MPRKTRTVRQRTRRRAAFTSAPLDASRNAASCFRRSSPRPANDGIGDARVHARRALQVRDLEGDALVLRAFGGQVRRAEVADRRRRGTCGS